MYKSRWCAIPEILRYNFTMEWKINYALFKKGIYFLHLVKSLLWKRLWNHSGTQLNVKRKGNIFKATNAKSPEHLTAGQWVKKTQMEKSQSVYALVWSPVFSCIFSSLKVYPAQCSALRMHTCGATMIHIITTCGDDSNQKPEVHPANNLKKRRSSHSTAVRERGKSMLHLLRVLVMSAYLRLPLRTKNSSEMHKDYEKHTKSTNTVNIREEIHWRRGSMDDNVSLGMSVFCASPSVFHLVLPTKCNASNAKYC